MESRKIDGNYVVSEDERFRGMVTGIVTVKSGVKFINHGMLCDDVIVEENSFFYNHGIVNGDVIGEGYAEVWGTVNGYVSSMLDVYIHENAVVNKKRYDCDEKQIKKG